MSRARLQSRRYSDLFSFLFFLFALLLSGCAGMHSGPSSSTPPSSGGGGGGGGGGGTSGTPFKHVFLVVEENHSYAEVIGNPQMPYLNSLAQKYGLATQYFANTHPSIGNYFMLTSGQIITNDDNFSGSVSVPDIVGSLESAGQSWQSFAESLPSVGYTGGDVYPYLRRHNPFTFFSEVQNNSAELNKLVPFSQFPTQLANGTLPNFSYIVPNALDDAHDGTLAQADQWLQSNIAPIIASQTFQQDGLLIITFDESVTTDTMLGGGHVATIIVSAKGKPGFQSVTTFQHPSTLRLILEALGATSMPGASGTAADMAEFFPSGTLP